MNPKDRIKELQQELTHAQYLYYVKDAPTMSDFEYDKKYPEYNFKKHKGYGTKEHTELIKQYGPCEIHRLSFLKNILG